MKRIKEFLELLIAFVTAWKLIVLPAVGLIVSIVIVAWKFGSKTINVTLPIWTIPVFVFLVLYLIANLIAYIRKRRKSTLFLYKGLYWKKPIFGFLNLTPICPIEGCGREVSCFRKDPTQWRTIGGHINGVSDINETTHFSYECPKHGRLLRVPDISIRRLHEEVKQEIKLVGQLVSRLPFRLLLIMMPLLKVL
jgi:hypothetical protein